MKKYYEAYDGRYRIIHEKGLSWSTDIPTPIVSDVISRYGISKESSILEIGCGEGRDAFPLLEQGYHVLATDISSEAICYCRQMKPGHEDHFSVLDCINDSHVPCYDLIYSVAVIHMLVEDPDRKAFCRFIHDHLSENGIALICSMGDGTAESCSEVSKAFDMVQRHHGSGIVCVPHTSLRMVAFETFENEMENNDLEVIEKGMTSSMPDFSDLMFVIVRKHE